MNRIWPLMRRLLSRRIGKLTANSKVKDVGQLGDEGSSTAFSGGTEPLVEDQKEIAERLVDEVEADVAGVFLNGAVVLE